VPVLGSIPLINRLFKYKDKSIEKISLIFIITPSVYDASNPNAIRAINHDVRTYSALEAERLDEMSTRLLPPLPSEESKAPVILKQGSVRQETNIVAPQPPKRSWMKRLFSREPAGSATLP
jgi:type II secretory pathway component GspD/PulD (secretin)